VKITDVTHTDCDACQAAAVSAATLMIVTGSVASRHTDTDIAGIEHSAKVERH
jgi:hypothetical protein